MPERRSTTPRNRSSSATADQAGPFGPIIFDSAVEADRIALDRLRVSGRVMRSTDLVPKQLAELASCGAEAATGPCRNRRRHGRDGGRSRVSSLLGLLPVVGPSRSHAARDLCWTALRRTATATS